MAASARESLLDQRQSLRGVGGRVTQVIQRIPLINSLSQRINLRTKRDTVILASVVALCIIFCLLYMLR